jgi:hypothetical protein
MSAIMTLGATSGGEALDGIWRINVSGQVYGPYSGHQIKAFATEGRVAPHSIVQSGQQGPWITAIDDPVLGQLFVVKRLPVAKPAEDRPVKSTVNVEPVSGNFIVVAEIRARSSVGFETALHKLGSYYRLNALVWVVHTERTAGEIRNELTQHLGRTDSLFIADASRNKTAWFNLGPEADAKIRQVWMRQTDAGSW